MTSIDFNFNVFLRKNPDGSIEIVGIEPALPKPTMATILDKAKEIAEKNLDGTLRSPKTVVE